MSTDERMLALARNVRAGLQKAIDYDDEVATVYAALMLAKRETEAEQSALSSAQGEGWVACSERLPADGQLVLFWGRDWLPIATHGLGRFYTGDNRTGLFEDETDQEGSYDDTCPKRHLVKNVTHWMPLPAPPQPKEKP